MLVFKGNGKVWTRFIWLRTGKQGTLVNTVTNLRIPQNAVNFSPK